MKRRIISVLLVVLLGLALASSPLAAQEAKKTDAKALMKALRLDEKDFKAIEAILVKDESALARHRADIQILQAQVTRLLLDKDPQIDQVQAVVKQSLDLELKIRMIQIGRQIEIKKLLGDERWAILYRFARAVAEAQREGRMKEAFELRKLEKDDQEFWNRLLSLSRRFLQ